MIDHRCNVMPGTRYFFTVTPVDRASRLWIERIAYLRVGFRVMRLDSRVSQRALNPDYNDYFDAYDEQGHLIGEYNASGSAIQETVYLGNQPVAVLKQNNLYTIHTDHLNTPRAISDSGRTVVWRWDADPFGTAAADPDPDPDMNGVKFTYNLRFPGQYFDSETGLHYNYFRDYDPSTGRYIESDPVGLKGGINTYAYVSNNPLRWIDPLGLAEINPNGAVPGGPWTPAGPGQPPDTFYGPKKPSGGKDICRWVPPEGEGGPKGSEGYWKTKTPGDPWQRFSPGGNPITPEQAHPGNPPPVVPWWVRIGVGIGLMGYSKPAY